MMVHTDFQIGSELVQVYDIDTFVCGRKFTRGYTFVLYNK